MNPTIKLASTRTIVKIQKRRDFATVIYGLVTLTERDPFSFPVPKTTYTL